MSNFGSVDEILDFAIAREEEANAFYLGLAQRMDKPWMSEVFQGFAEQELKHKFKLERVKDGKILLPSHEKITDLKIADYLVDVPVSDDMSYQDALTVAMKREKAAFKLYMDLARSAEDEGLSGTFEALAQEEAGHKLWLETNYDEYILVED